MEASADHPQKLHFAVLACDITLFTVNDEKLYVRLVRVDRPPHYTNSQGLPGGLLLPTETAEQAVERLVKEKAGIAPEKIFSEQLYTFSHPARDARGRVVAVAYNAYVPWEALTERERTSSKDAWWELVTKARPLAYDHDEMLASAQARLRSRVHYTTLITKLMPSEFTLTELEKTYEIILGAPLDKRNFRKKVLKLEILRELPKKREGVRFRPAQLYSFVSKKVTEMQVL